MPEQQNNANTPPKFSLKNDKPLEAYAHADAINHEMERPTDAPLTQRMTHGQDKK